MSYGKLVRDNIPNIIQQNGEEAITRVLSKDEYKIELEKKLLEECREVIESQENDRLEELAEEIKILLLPKDANDERNVVVEIKGAVGGDEANIFAGDLFRMYQHYAESKGWKIQVDDATPGAAGGYSNISFSISGEMVYSFMKYESGGHRVQRIPVTESNGRIQTSIATVLVSPEATDDDDIELAEKDLRIDTFCSSGPGGQGVNTTYSAVRVTYIPTGDFVACQIARSQHENKATALRLLKTKLKAKRDAEREEKEGAMRQSLVGSGERAEKIRTYNYPQNRVTDHRIGFTINRLDAIIEGKLDLVIQELINEDQKRKLSNEESVRL
jgi:peptide chain release factor 1